MRGLVYNNALVRAGRRHLARGRGGQDHALSLACDHGVVLVAADGVSTASGGGASHNEAGAWIVAELAAAGALAALTAESEPNDVKLAAVQAVVEGLAPLYRRLGVRARDGLATTLVLAVITPRWTAIWASGDGYWGLVTVPSGSLMIEHQTRPPQRCDEGISAQGGVNYDVLSSLVSTSAPRGIDRAAAELRLVGYTRAAVAAWVATDGLRDEPAAAELLVRPLRNSRLLADALTRPDHSDDLGVAWAAVALPEIAEALYAAA